MKQLLKKILIPILASRPVSAIADHIISSGIPVFMLHRFNKHTDSNSGHKASDLHHCLTYLKDHGYHFVSIEHVINALNGKSTLPKRAIAFTIDDGFIDQATIAAPIFIEHDCPVTIFLITGMLDNELWPWDDKVSYLIKNTQESSVTLKLSGQTRNYPLNNKQQQTRAIGDIQNWIKTLDAEFLNDYLESISSTTKIALPDRAPDTYKPMSWDQARQLEKQGIHFAPHTRSHRILSRLNENSARDEIIHSWKRLSEELASPKPVFCYPTGRKEDFTDRDIYIVKRAGLVGAVSTEPTYIKLNSNDKNYTYRLPRFGFPDTFEDFIQYSSWIERAKTQLLRR